jgi:hypothetical protein
LYIYPVRYKLQFRCLQGLQIGQLARGFHFLSSWLIYLFRFGNHVIWIFITLIFSVAAAMRLKQAVCPTPYPPPEQMQFKGSFLYLSHRVCTLALLRYHIFTHVCISKSLLSGTYFYRRDPRPNMWNGYYFIKLPTLFFFYYFGFPRVIGLKFNRSYWFCFLCLYFPRTDSPNERVLLLNPPM